MPLKPRARQQNRVERQLSKIVTKDAYDTNFGEETFSPYCSCVPVCTVYLWMCACAAYTPPQRGVRANHPSEPACGYAMIIRLLIQHNQEGGVWIRDYLDSVSNSKSGPGVWLCRARARAIARQTSLGNNQSKCKIWPGPPRIMHS